MKSGLMILVIAIAMAVVACGGGSSVGEQAANSVGSAPFTEDFDVDDPTNAILEQAGIDTDRLLDDGSGSAASGGSGSATVWMGDMVYTAAGNRCLQSNGYVDFNGLGQADDGTSVWLSISGSTNEDYNGDGQDDRTASVAVDYGRTDLFQEVPEGNPELTANTTEFSGESPIDPALLKTFDFEIVGDTISGAGAIEDFSGIVIPAGESADFRFEASCS